MQPERPTELPPLPHHGPLNSSSALVPGDTAFALRSLVNQVVPTSCVDLCLPHLLFRPPTAEDGMQVLDLHRELFPLEYDSTFYDAAVGITPGVAALGLWLPTERLEELLRRPLYGLPPELLVGIVTLARDGFLIGVAHSVDVLWRHGEYVADPIKTFGSPVQCSKKLSYILTLGVSETFRRRGLASLLVQKAIQLLKTEGEVYAIYLHVIDYNAAAVRFYKKHGFDFINTIPKYYTIHGVDYTGAVLAMYLRPPPSRLSLVQRMSRWFSQ